MIATTTRVLLEEGYRSTDEIFRGWALMTAMARVEHYQAECELFQKKYEQSLAELERATHSMPGQEDFAVEDDLDDWEFADRALAWWQSKVKELRVAGGT